MISKTSVEPETSDGHLHLISPRRARYIRLSNIRNSENASIHLAELMVSEKDEALPPDKLKARKAALQNYCQAVLGLNEFIYID